MLRAVPQELVGADCGVDAAPPANPSWFIGGWSRRHSHVAMSAFQVKFADVVVCSAEVINLRSMMRDLGAESSRVI